MVIFRSHITRIISLLALMLASCALPGPAQVLAEQASAEIEIISAYLPKPLTDEEVTALVQQTIQETGASSKADMGKVMAALMPKVKGRADGKLVNQIVSQHLS